MRNLILLSPVLLLGLALVILVSLNIIWSSMSSTRKVNFVNNQISKKASIKTASILVSQGDKVLVDYQKGLSADKPFAIASITKLYTHAVIFQLIDDDKLSYDTKVIDILGDDIQGIHVLDGVDYTNEITIRHLIDQTSGLADYETDKLGDGTTLIDQLVHQDIPVDYQQSLDYTREIGGKFTPGTNGKAYYSNMNASLLAAVAEKITGQPITTLYQENIFAPLGLTQTQAITEDAPYESFYKGDVELKLPQYLSSNIAPGGLFATGSDLHAFFKAFYNGELFNKTHLENPAFRSIQWFPVQYGSGMMSIQMNRLLSPIIPAPQIIGHSGSTGSFAFYDQSKDVFISGTVNQVDVRPYSYLYMYLSAH